MLCRKPCSLRRRPRQNVILHANQSNSTPMRQKIVAEEQSLNASGWMQKERCVIPNMCWSRAKAVMLNEQKTTAIGKAPLARQVSARTLSTKIPREETGARDRRMDSHGHRSGDPTCPALSGRPQPSVGRWRGRVHRSCRIRILSAVGPEIITCVWSFPPPILPNAAIVDTPHARFIVIGLAASVGRHN